MNVTITVAYFGIFGTGAMETRNPNKRAREWEKRPVHTSRKSGRTMRITKISSDLDTGRRPELKSDEISVIRFVLKEKILILIEIARR